MAVHQLIPTFTLGDATAQAAVHLRLLLRRMGVWGELYAGEVAPGLESLVRPVRALRPAADDWVLYHHGIASPLSFAYRRLHCRRGLVFHNISPERYYRGTPLREALVAGRAELAGMAARTELAIGVSEFNAAELREAGFPTVATVPLFLEPERFSAAQADAALLARLRGAGPSVLFVGRVVAHKRVDDLLSLHAELRRIRPEARLRIVGGYEPGSALFRELTARARAIGGVELLGRLSHAELVAAYRSASVFVSMSEHEGFGVPLVEAMASELPVLAFGAAAVPETLGGAGIVFDEKRFALLAELVCAVSEDGALRARLLEGQARRLGELSADNAARRLSEVFRSVDPGLVRIGPGDSDPSRPEGRSHRSRETEQAEQSRQAEQAQQSRQAEQPQQSRQKNRRAMPRLAVVVQRYGDVSGGAERHAQSIVEHLAPHAAITVLTSCAKDHLTWANAFPEGEEQLGPARVLRFPVEAPRDIRAFNRVWTKVYGEPLDRIREELFVADQGPRAPGLLRHLAERHRDYDAFLFFTYLYAPTAWGLPLVADRALLVPTAHDEPPLKFGVYDDVFTRPRTLLCNTEEEVALIRGRFPNAAPTRVVGVGVDAPEADGARFREAQGLGRYLFYVGRLEEGKGIGELLTLHRAMVRRNPDVPELVLAGGVHMHIHGPKVRVLGRIDEQTKHDAIAGAEAVVVPSRFESLSLLTLEAFAQGTPVLVNAGSEVLTGQVRRSGAGATYSDAASFAAGLEQVRQHREELARRARGYARQHRWEHVVDIYREELARIVEGNP